LVLVGISFFNYQQTKELKDRDAREELVKQREAEIMFMKNQYMEEYAKPKEANVHIE
jgi:vacuolar-type H+-ATPase subunit F/Vma7